MLFDNVIYSESSSDHTNCITLKRN